MSSRLRTLGFLLWTGLLFASLRPVPGFQELASLATAPVRYLAEIAKPLRILGRGRVLAAERVRARTAEESVGESLELIEALFTAALPSESRLVEGRRLLAAEVRGRVVTNKDRLRIHLPDGRGVVIGLPVVFGDSYVGRVVRVFEQRRDGTTEAEVELVTAGGFLVGARVADGPHGIPVYLTVGGVDADKGTLGAGVRLAVHNPSDRELAGGLARVYELFSDAEPFAELAEGFRLGDVWGDPDGKRWTLLPEIDYQDGLSHVIVLAPDVPLEPLPARVPVLLDENWLAVRPLNLADPSPWREAAKLPVGTSHGVMPGAAVTSAGARLIGRVTRAGPISSDVSYLGDPGFHVVCVARFDDGGAPRVLGRLHGLGRSASGAVRLRWVPRIELGAGTSERSKGARLYTGSGDAGISTGFYLGHTELPLHTQRDEPVELVLETDLTPVELGALYVRTRPAEDAGRVTSHGEDE